MSEITPRGKISTTELLKSIRDLAVIGIAGAIPQILTLLESTDFGEWNLIASIVLAAAAPLINRLLNILRIK